jgi:hypothetical protein
MCVTEICSKCKHTINTHRCSDRNRRVHSTEEKSVTCSACIQKVYAKREQVDKLLRLLW